MKKYWKKCAERGQVLTGGCPCCEYTKEWLKTRCETIEVPATGLKVYDWELPVFDGMEQDGEAVVQEYENKIMAEGARQKLCRKCQTTHWTERDQNCDRCVSTSSRGVATKATGTVKVRVPTKLRQLTSNEKHSLQEFIDAQIAGAEAILRDAKEYEDNDEDGGLVKVAKRVISASKGWVMPTSYSSRTIDITAPAAAGKSHLLMEHASRGMVYLVPTHSERLAKALKLDSRRAVACYTPQFWVAAFMNGERCLDSLIDEAYLQHTGAHVAGKLMAHRLNILAGDEEQINAVDFGKQGWKWNSSVNTVVDMKVLLGRNYRSLDFIVHLLNVVNPKRKAIGMRGPGGSISFGDDGTQDFTTCNLQATKREYAAGKVLTTHEYQGGEAEHVHFKMDGRIPNARPFGPHSLTNYDYVGLSRAREHLSLSGNANAMSLLGRLKVMAIEEEKKGFEQIAHVSWRWTKESGMKDLSTKKLFPAVVASSNGPETMSTSQVLEAPATGVRVEEQPPKAEESFVIDEEDWDDVRMCFGKKQGGEYWTENGWVHVKMSWNFNSQETGMPMTPGSEFVAEVNAKNSKFAPPKAVKITSRKNQDGGCYLRAVRNDLCKEAFEKFGYNPAIGEVDEWHFERTGRTLYWKKVTNVDWVANTAHFERQRGSERRARKLLAADTRVGMAATFLPLTPIRQIGSEVRLDLNQPSAISWPGTWTETSAIYQRREMSLGHLVSFCLRNRVAPVMIRSIIVNVNPARGWTLREHAGIAVITFSNAFATSVPRIGTALTGRDINNLQYGLLRAAVLAEEAGLRNACRSVEEHAEYDRMVELLTEEDRTTRMIRTPSQMLHGQRSRKRGAIRTLKRVFHEHGIETQLKDYEEPEFDLPRIEPGACRARCPGSHDSCTSPDVCKTRCNHTHDDLRFREVEVDMGNQEIVKHKVDACRRTASEEGFEETHRMPVAQAPATPRFRSLRQGASRIDWSEGVPRGTIVPNTSGEFRLMSTADVLATAEHEMRGFVPSDLGAMLQENFAAMWKITEAEETGEAVIGSTEAEATVIETKRKVWRCECVEEYEWKKLAEDAGEVNAVPVVVVQQWLGETARRQRLVKSLRLKLDQAQSSISALQSMLVKENDVWRPKTHDEMARDGDLNDQDGNPICRRNCGHTFQYYIPLREDGSVDFQQFRSNAGRYDAELMTLYRGQGQEGFGFKQAVMALSMHGMQKNFGREEPLTPELREFQAKYIEDFKDIVRHQNCEECVSLHACPVQVPCGQVHCAEPAAHAHVCTPTTGPHSVTDCAAAIMALPTVDQAIAAIGLDIALFHPDRHACIAHTGIVEESHVAADLVANHVCPAPPTATPVACTRPHHISEDDCLAKAIKASPATVHNTVANETFCRAHCHHQAPHSQADCEKVCKKRHGKDVEVKIEETHDERTRRSGDSKGCKAADWNAKQKINYLEERIKAASSENASLKKVRIAMNRPTFSRGNIFERVYSNGKVKLADQDFHLPKSATVNTYKGGKRLDGTKGIYDGKWSDWVLTPNGISKFLHYQADHHKREFASKLGFELEVLEDALPEFDETKYDVCHYKQYLEICSEGNYGAALKELWNKIMHSINGNIDTHEEVVRKMCESEERWVPLAQKLSDTNTELPLHPSRGETSVEQSRIGYKPYFEGSVQDRGVGKALGLVFFDFDGTLDVRTGHDIPKFVEFASQYRFTPIVLTARRATIRKCQDMARLQAIGVTGIMYIDVVSATTKNKVMQMFADRLHVPYCHTWLIDDEKERNCTDPRFMFRGPTEQLPILGPNLSLAIPDYSGKTLLSQHCPDAFDWGEFTTGMHAKVEGKTTLMAGVVCSTQPIVKYLGLKHQGDWISARGEEERKKKASQGRSAEWYTSIPEFVNAALMATGRQPRKFAMLVCTCGKKTPWTLSYVHNYLVTCICGNAMNTEHRYGPQNVKTARLIVPDRAYALHHDRPDFGLRPQAFIEAGMQENKPELAVPGASPGVRGWKKRHALFGNLPWLPACVESKRPHAIAKGQGFDLTGWPVEQVQRLEWFMAGSPYGPTTFPAANGKSLEVWWDDDNMRRGNETHYGRNLTGTYKYNNVALLYKNLSTCHMKLESLFRPFPRGDFTICGQGGRYHDVSKYYVGPLVTPRTYALARLAPLFMDDTHGTLTLVGSEDDPWQRYLVANPAVTGCMTTQQGGRLATLRLPKGIWREYKEVYLATLLRCGHIYGADEILLDWLRAKKIEVEIVPSHERLLQEPETYPELTMAEEVTMLLSQDATTYTSTVQLSRAPIAELQELPSMEYCLLQGALASVPRQGKFVEHNRSSLSLGVPALWRGLPYYRMGLRGSQDQCYRGDETSQWRKPEFKGLYNTKFPKERKKADHVLLAKVDDVIAQIRALAKGRKIIVSASPDGPPPPESMGFVPVAFNTTRTDWLKVNCTLASANPREWAFWRLAACYVGVEVWIVNGRNVESMVLPPTVEGRISSWNANTATPLLLSSSVCPAGLLHDVTEFSSWLHYASTYGSDEAMLMNKPLAGFFPFTLTRMSAWAMPMDYGYADVEIYEKGKRTYVGEWSRVTMSKHLTKPMAPPRNLRKQLQGSEAMRILKLDSQRTPVPEVANPLEPVEGKEDMLLVVTFGTRGDVEPVVKLAELIQAMGVKVRVWHGRHVTAKELRDLDCGSIRHLIPAFARLWASGGAGWKCVMLPHAPTFGPHILYDMTPWSSMASYKAPWTVLGQAAARLAEHKGAHIIIGATPGCNTLAYQNDKPIKFIDEKKPRTKKYIVLGSGGIEEAEEQYLEDPSWEIHTDPHHYDAFQDAAEVRCPGGQGIMRVLQANNVPKVHVMWPSKDRDYQLDPMQGNFFEQQGIAALEAELIHHGFLKPATFAQRAASYLTTAWFDVTAITVVLALLSFWFKFTSLGMYSLACLVLVNGTLATAVLTDPYARAQVAHKSRAEIKAPWFVWLRRVLLVCFLVPTLWSFLHVLASFPSLWLFSRTFLFKVPAFAMLTVMRWPILLWYGGATTVMLIFIVTTIARQVALSFLASDNRVYFRVRFAKSWMFMRHVLFTDGKTGESVELGWSGHLNLKAPFTGRLVQNDNKKQPGELWIPVPVNFPAVKRKTMHMGDKYSPWFNCQTQSVVASKDLTVFTIIFLFQLYCFPITMGAYMTWYFFSWCKPEIADLPVSSFFRMGTATEYEDLEKELQARDEQAQAWKKEVFDEVNETARKAEAAVVKAIVVENEAGKDTVITDRDVIEQACPTPDVLAQAAQPREPESMKELIDHAADMIIYAKASGVPEEEAYHAAILAIRRQLLEFKKPDEVTEWETRYSPRVRTRFNEMVQALSDFLRYHLGSDWVGFDAFQKAYQWLEGLGAKAKVYVMRIWDLFDFLGELAMFAGDQIWKAFSKVARMFMDWAFKGKLNKRYKAVWALGGVAKNPKMAAQKRMQEAVAFHQYTRKGFFEDEWALMCKNLRDQLPDASLPEGHPDRMFPAPPEGGSKVKPQEWVSAPSQVDLGGRQQRSVGIPRLPVVNESEAEILRLYGFEGRLKIDVERTQQVNAMLERQVKRHLDGAYKVAINPHVMADMSARYAYRGLVHPSNRGGDFDPIAEKIPQVLSDERLAEADSVAHAMAEANPEAFADPKLTQERALMRYYEWQRRIGSPYERHYRLRWEAWRAGVGYQVLKESVHERETGVVEKAAFGSFVKSQEVPWDKKPRGVTFMSITRWFKEQVEQFERNSRVVWRTTGEGKNMPLNQNMADFFRQIQAMDSKYEADCTEADSRFDAFQSEVISRLAYYGWKDERLASMKRSKMEATTDGFIFNLHMNPGEHVPTWMKPLMRHPNAKLYSNVSDKIRGGATGLSDTGRLNKDAIQGGLCASTVRYLRQLGVTNFSHRDFFAKEEKTVLVEVNKEGGGTEMKEHTMTVGKYCSVKNTGDDNISGVNIRRIIQDFAPHLLDPQSPVKFDADEFAYVCRLDNMDVTILQHDANEGRWLEYLSKFMRPATMMDRQVVRRVEKIYEEKGIVLNRGTQYEGMILDPTTNLPVSQVVYQNLKSPMGKQTALKAYKEQAFRHRYLKSLIERDAGHMALAAFVPEFYLQCASTISASMIRYLAGAFGECLDRQGLPMTPQGELYEWIASHVQVKHEDVGRRMPYFLVDGNLRRRTNGEAIPAEFLARLKELKKIHVPRYSKVIHDHFTVAHKTPEYHERLMAKLNKGFLGVDEGAKMLVDSMREWAEKLPRKLTRGVVSTLEMVYPDEIWNGSGRVEAFVYLAAEKELKDGGVVTSGAFQSRINQSPYAGVCNAPAAYHRFNTPEGRAALHEHPLYVWQNANVWINIHYGLMWWVERWILSLPFVGLAYAVMMFYLIDVTKLYAVLGLLFWLAHGKASQVIGGLLPRDIYIWSKRFSDWSCSYIPIQVGYITRFDIPLRYLSDVVEWVAELWQHGLHITPITSSTPGRLQNPWEPVANEFFLKMYSLMPHVASVSGPTGTGKSTWFVYALMRINDLERGGNIWISAPRKVLRDDWGLPSWMAVGNHDTPLSERNSQYQVLKKGKEKRGNARIFLCTHGHLVSRIEAGEVGPNDIVLFDESHEGSGPMIKAQDELIKASIWIGYLSATPAPVSGINQGPLIDSSEHVQKRWKTKTVTFPAKTNVVAMYQDAITRKEVDPTLGHSHHDMAQRTIIAVASKTNQRDGVTEVAAGINDLRKAYGDSIPPVIEFTSDTARSGKEERERILAGGRYVLVCTEGIIRAGYDVKPAAWFAVTSGLTHQPHEGSMITNIPTTQTQRDQFNGRVGRNSADRPGLVYQTEEHGTGDETIIYPSGAYFAEEVVAKAYNFNWLKPLPYQGPEQQWNHFQVREDIEYSPEMRNALRFVFLAAMSGLHPREMRTFYFTHAQRGVPLDEDYEWMDRMMDHKRRANMRFPAWDLVRAAMEQKPFIVNTENVVGSESAVDNLRFAGVIYPVGRNWLPFRELLEKDRDIVFRGDVTNEAKAYEEMTKQLHETIAKLHRRIANLKKPKAGQSNSWDKLSRSADAHAASNQLERVREELAAVEGNWRGRQMHRVQENARALSEEKKSRKEQKEIDAANRMIAAGVDTEKAKAIKKKIAERRKARAEAALNGTKDSGNRSKLRTRAIKCLPTCRARLPICKSCDESMSHHNKLKCKDSSIEVCLNCYGTESSRVSGNSTPKSTLSPAASEFTPSPDLLAQLQARLATIPEQEWLEVEDEFEEGVVHMLEEIPRWSWKKNIGLSPCIMKNVVSGKYRLDWQ